MDIDLSIFVRTVQQKPRHPSPGCCFTPLWTIFYFCHLTINPCQFFSSTKNSKSVFKSSTFRPFALNVNTVRFKRIN